MKTLGLVGRKLEHSFSKTYFTQKFENLSLPDFQYINIEVDVIDDIMSILQKDDTIIGFNVTIPFKEKILNILDEVDETVGNIKAVNTVKVNRKNGLITLLGFNTDVHGFRFSIKPFLNHHHQKALILGTGGASKAVAFVFDSLGIDYFFVSRTKKNNTTLLYSDVNEYAISQYKLIVNCTPIGMYPNLSDKVDLPYNTIGKEHLCIDLVYNPPQTHFLHQSNKQGAHTLNGISMLHLQADKAFEIFLD